MSSDRGCCADQPGFHLQGADKLIFLVNFNKNI